jgi:outer membrane protein OmpA-like peptidoglycan-associated protein
MFKNIFIIVIVSLLTLSGCANISKPKKEADNEAVAVETNVVEIAANPHNVWSENMESLKTELEQLTDSSNAVVTKMDDNRLKIEIPSDFSFAIGKATVSSNLRTILEPFALSLIKNTAANVSITGHTDSTGSDKINNPLSLKRAISVRDYLVANGVEVSRLSAYGRGSTHPIAPNDTSVNRAKNRRVEIFVAELSSVTDDEP